MLRGALSLALAALALGAGPARAATFDGTTLSGGPEADAVTLSYDGANYVYEDAAGIVTDRCTRRSPTTIACPYAPGGPARIRLGGGDDTFAVEGDPTTDPATAAGLLRVVGGAGDDTLTGGAETDLLDGGAGANVLAGGAGGDTLVTGGDAGALDGGPGDDELVTRDAARNRVTGGRGLDALDLGRGDRLRLADGEPDTIDACQGRIGPSALDNHAWVLGTASARWRLDDDAVGDGRCVGRTPFGTAPIRLARGTTRVRARRTFRLTFTCPGSAGLNCLGDGVAVCLALDPRCALGPTATFAIPRGRRLTVAFRPSRRFRSLAAAQARRRRLGYRLPPDRVVLWSTDGNGRVTRSVARIAVSPG